MTDVIEQTGKDHTGNFILKMKVTRYGLFIEPEGTMHNGHADMRLSRNQCMILKKAIDDYMNKVI